MSPRVQAERIQNRLRTPRIPSLSFQFELFHKALMKSVSLFIQGFFIAHVSRVADLFRIAVFKLGAFKKSAFQKLSFKTIFPQFYICFSTSVK